MPDDEVFYVKIVPELRLENGMFHICFEVGHRRFEFVLRPSLYAAFRRKGDAAIKKFERPADVVRIEDKRR